MTLTQTCADMSRAIKLKVGCVIVKNDNINSFSWNGTPTGWDNACEKIADVDVNDPRYNYNNFSWELVTKDEVIHAEANAILKLAKDGESGNGADLFCTHAPCIHCAKLIYGAGIRKVFYREDYKSTDGLDFLNKCNIEIEKV